MSSEPDDAGADQVIAAALARARELAIKVSAALADSGGHLKRLARLDGAEIPGVSGGTAAQDRECAQAVADEAG
jgi:uncharacterized protein GlcG (DUF336 family)